MKNNEQNEVDSIPYCKLIYSLECQLDSSKNEHLVVDILNKSAKIQYQKGIGMEYFTITLKNKDFLDFKRKILDLSIETWPSISQSKEIVEDGYSWQIELRSKSKVIMEKNGQNSFPPKWKDFKKLIIWLYLKEE